ncbi:hypothetical protein Ahy_B01g052455 [Arachis hypogaea]|uniref:BZIP domain-containing protein n=1 Tax=Arachis hypogaea TaxID=3818 RepID=A0A445APH1_ARAHY|nr:hypothetical protein Ahy_B01g052455 [Arachis hypogaea]
MEARFPKVGCGIEFMALLWFCLTPPLGLTVNSVATVRCLRRCGRSHLLVSIPPQGLGSLDSAVACVCEELRKERKREANRKCAQRKRKREQEAFQELEGSVAKLRTEVQLLHEELTRLHKENKELDQENNSIQEEIFKMHGMKLSAKFVISSAVDEV